MERLGLLFERAFTIPLLEAQVVALVEFADALFPGQSPRLERAVAAPGIEEVAADMGPAKGEQNGVIG